MSKVFKLTLCINTSYLAGMMILYTNAEFLNYLYFLMSKVTIIVIIALSFPKTQLTI